MLEAKQRIEGQSKCSICGEELKGEYTIGLHPNGRHYALCDRCSVVDDAVDYIEYGSQGLLDVLKDIGYLACDVCGEEHDLEITLDKEQQEVTVHCNVCQEDTTKSITQEELQGYVDDYLATNFDNSDGYDNPEDWEDEYPDADNPERYSFNYKPKSRLKPEEVAFNFGSKLVDLDSVDDEEEVVW